MFELQKHGFAIILSGALITGGFAAVSVAAPWTNPSGAANSFTYANGQDLNGLFGDPVVTGDSFHFPNLDFTAGAAGGTIQSKNDVVSFDIIPNPGLSFGLIRVTAFGSYAVTGPSGENRVDLDAEMRFTENGGLGRTFTGPMVTNPSFPQTSGSGDWSGLSAVDMTFKTPPPHGNLHFEFQGDVLAVSGPGGTAEINMALQDGLTFEFVPEPTSLSILLTGAAALVLRRRR